MKDTVLVTGVKDQNFTLTEKNEKKTIDMLKVSFLTQNSGIDALGFLPSQVNFMDEQKKVVSLQITKVPALYDVEYAMVPGKNNKPTMTIVGFNFLKEVDLKPLFKVS